MALRGTSLSPKQEQVIICLLTAPTLGAAAQQAGVGLRTLMRWLTEPPFQQAYRAARAELIAQATSRLQQACGVAVTTLLRVMLEATSPPSARVAAARTVLDMSLKAVDLENFEVRLQALEAVRPERPR
jgi:hypothetical protein